MHTLPTSLHKHYINTHYVYQGINPHYTFHNYFRLHLKITTTAIITSIGQRDATGMSVWCCSSHSLFAMSRRHPLSDGSDKYRDLGGLQQMPIVSPTHTSTDDNMALVYTVLQLCSAAMCGQEPFVTWSGTTYAQNGALIYSGWYNTPLCSSASRCALTQHYLQVQEKQQFTPPPPSEGTTTYSIASSRSRGEQLLQYGHQPRNILQQHVPGSHQLRFCASRADSSTHVVASDTNVFVLGCAVIKTPEYLPSNASKEEPDADNTTEAANNCL